jgi:hypothetical protein
MAKRGSTGLFRFDKMVEASSKLHLFANFQFVDVGCFKKSIVGADGVPFVLICRVSNETTQVRTAEPGIVAVHVRAYDVVSSSCAGQIFRKSVPHETVCNTFWFETLLVYVREHTTLW